MEKPENNDDCFALAPLVMTLFDGEADEIEARRARAHLLVCQTCARRWLDWNRSRDLLQIAPVPVAPPHLLWRVLLACRLGAAPQRAKTTGAVSANLSAPILARTTRQNSKSPTRRALSPWRISALATPALAVCLLVLQRDAWIEAPTSPPPSASVRPSIAPLSAPSRAVSSVKTSVPTRAPKDEFQLPRRAPRVVPVATPAFQNDFRPAVHAVFSSRPTPMKAEPAPILVVTIEAPREVKTTFGGRGALDERTKAASRRAPQSEIRVARSSLALPVAVRPAAFSPRKSALRLRAARWRNTPLLASTSSVVFNGATRPAALTTRIAPQILRVSLPSTAAPQPARLLAENFDADDERIEEIRSVVDDFRATLGSDESSAESTFDDDSTG